MIMMGGLFVAAVVGTAVYLGIVRPRIKRRPLIEALEIMCTKRELRPPKKHGNIPL